MKNNKKNEKLKMYKYKHRYRKKKWTKPPVVTL